MVPTLIRKKLCIFSTFHSGLISGKAPLVYTFTIFVSNGRPQNKGIHSQVFSAELRPLSGHAQSREPCIRFF